MSKDFAILSTCLEQVYPTKRIFDRMVHFVDIYLSIFIKSLLNFAKLLCRMVPWWDSIFFHETAMLTYTYFCFKSEESRFVLKWIFFEVDFSPRIELTEGGYRCISDKISLFV